jgi:hypothetical protein
MCYPVASIYARLADITCFCKSFLVTNHWQGAESMLIDQDTKIISVAELSKLLQFSQFRVKSLITSGYIKAEKVNGRYIIDAKSVNEWWTSLTNGKRRDEIEHNQQFAA